MTEPLITHSDLVSFADLKVNLKREDVSAYRTQVSNLRDTLESYIASHPDYNLVKMLHSGSVMKGTALKTVNDMDVAVYIKPSDDTVDESRLINWLVQRLKEVYPTMKPDQFVPQDHCVTVSFKGSGLDVDVVPVIYEGDKDDQGYLIVKDTGERVLTSIPRHLEFIRKRKKVYPEHYAQTIRFMKWWIRLKKTADDSFRFKSFMAELIVARLADDGFDLSNYPKGLMRVFAYIVNTGLKTRISFEDYYAATSLPNTAQGVIEIFDPVNPSNNIAAKYSESDRGRIVEAAQDALDALTEAYRSNTKGRATEMWQEVLGPSFRPA